MEPRSKVRHGSEIRGRGAGWGRNLIGAGLERDWRGTGAGLAPDWTVNLRAGRATCPFPAGNDDNCGRQGSKNDDSRAPPYPARDRGIAIRCDVPLVRGQCSPSRSAAARRSAGRRRRRHYDRGATRLHHGDAVVCILCRCRPLLAPENLPLLCPARGRIERGNLSGGCQPHSIAGTAVRDRHLPRRHLSRRHEDRLGLVCARSRQGIGVSGRGSCARDGLAAPDPGTRARPALGRCHAVRLGDCGAGGRLDVCTGAGWSAPQGGGAVRSVSVCCHLQLAGLSRLVVRLLRPHVGALCVLGVRARLSRGQLSGQLPRPAAAWRAALRSGRSSSSALEPSAA